MAGGMAPVLEDFLASVKPWVLSPVPPPLPNAQIKKIKKEGRKEKEALVAHVSNTSYLGG
jgi:hypothetical protein